MNAMDAVKTMVFRYTTLGVPEYRFNLEPIQLATLVFEIERLKHTIGSIVEIGVARGLTTRFLCEHFVKTGCANQDLYAIDTFSSFLAGDLDYEVEHRGKKKADLEGNFGYNDFEIWKKNFRAFPFVKAIQSDCATFDYSTIAPIKLALLDVDLYLPVRRALPRLYEHLRVGGVILVDDVQSNTRYDGAYQAYAEFCDELQIIPTVVGNKLGIIRK